MRYALVDGWVRVLRRRWHAGAAVFLTVAVTGSALVLMARPVYRAESRLRLGEPPPMSGVSPTSGFFGLLRMGGDPFANDLELLGSRTVAEQVVDDAALHVKLAAPRGWHRDSLFASLSADRTTTQATFTVTRVGDAITITSPKHPAVRGRSGEELRFGGVRAVFLPWRDGMPQEFRIATIPHAQAARELGGQLQVERTRRDANVIRVAFQSTDPALTREVVESAVDRFIELRTGIMQRESGETVDSLRSVADRARRELLLAEAALEDAQRASGLIAPEVQAEVNIERFSETLVELETARTERDALTQALVRSTEATDPAASWAALLSYPRFLENETIGQLMTQLFELEQRRRELARRRTPDNRELRAVLDQIEHLDRSLRAAATDLGSTLNTEVAALERRTNEMQSALENVPSAAIELGRRQRELRVLTEMVVVTEQRLRQEELRQALTFANIQVIDPPALRDRQVWPRRKLGPAIAVLIAGFTAFAGVVVMERADLAVRTGSQLKAAADAPVLATVRADEKPPLVPEADVRALLCRAARTGAKRLAIADIAGGRAAEIVVSALRAHASAHDTMGVCIEPIPPIDGFGAASNAVGKGSGIVLAVEMGRDTADALRRSATLLRDAGGAVDGVIAVCRNAAAFDEVWSA